MPVAHLNPGALRWALARAGKKPTDLASALRQPPEKVEGWLTGTSRPTFKQAQDIARRLWVPFGYLFMSTPPEEPLPLPDFRRSSKEAYREVSVDLQAVVYDVLRKQDWYRDYRLDREAAPIPVVGSFTSDTPVFELAADMAEHIEVGTGADHPDQSRFLRTFTHKIENLGILVMRNGVVYHNTNRPLDVREFRGFSIADPMAPVIFVNAADSIAAQIFTLAHELAHIWIGKGGISDADYTIRVGHGSNIEDYCNAVAGEMLLPWDKVADWWVRRSSTENWIRKVAGKFHLSTVMVARRLWEEGEIDRPSFFAFYDNEKGRWSEKRQSKGGHFYRTAIIRNSRLLTETMLADIGVSPASTSVREASRLLRIKPVGLSSLRKL